MCHHEEPDRHRARWKAALRVYGSNPPESHLPASHEIHSAILRIEQGLERDALGLRDEQTARGPEPSGEPPAPLSLNERFRRYESLLAPLEQVHEHRRRHPEGDVLYHSLQVFELARRAVPYDEELLLAALLHDVGKAIDPKQPVQAALDALDGSITPRTAWLIEHLDDAQSLYAGTLGVRSHRRLKADENFDELALLAECERKGRVRGAPTPDVVDALAYLRRLADADEEERPAGEDAAAPRDRQRRR